MANADVIYAIAVQGAQEAVAEFNKVGAVTKQVAEAQTGLANKANAYADAFKKVSRDIGTVGGQTAQAFTHAADEALSVVGLISGGGGLVAAISLAGIAVGRLYEGWRQYKDEQSKAIAASLGWFTQHNKELEKAVTLSEKVFGRSGFATREDAEKRIIASKAEIKKLNEDIEKKEQDAAYRVGPDRVKRQAEINELVSKRNLFEDDLNKAVNERNKYLAESVKQQREALIDAREAHRIAKEMAAADERKQRAVNGLAAEGGWVAKAMFGGEARAKQMMDFLEADSNETDLDRLIAFQESQFANILETQRAIDVDRYRDLGDAALENHEKFKKWIGSMKDAKFILEAFKNVTAPTFAAGMMVVGTATDLATKYMIDFGTINRDNWRDMLSWSKDKQAAFAAEAQAALWSLAKQAAPKALYENAEAIASVAAAAGEYGKGNIPGGVLHSAAAVGHYAASAAYGTIAAGAGAGAIAIGASRGAGGPIPTAGGGGSRASAPSVGAGGGAPSSSSGGGSRDSGGGGTVQITYVYEAGSINAADERATARTVANGVGAARGSWFERRRMERRV